MIYNRKINWFISISVFLQFSQFLFIFLFCPQLVLSLVGKNHHGATGDEEINFGFSVPTIEEHLKSLDVVVDMTAFKTCDLTDCQDVCGTTNAKLAYCDHRNKKLCMCDPKNFHPADMNGEIAAVDRNKMEQRNCSIGCNKRNSYGRFWAKGSKTLYCICLLKQVTQTGITLCDPVAKSDVCNAICQTDSGLCSFNGACLCRHNWEPFFDLTIPNVRKEGPEDISECGNICAGYHHDYVSRLYDPKSNDPNDNRTYILREKYCLCGEWLDLSKFPETKEIIGQGFQLCTGLKCKQRCGMDEAVCEPHFRRGCLCLRENIIIGSHLWARLPTPHETKCYQTCSSHGFDARVIEWNPFMSPADMRFEPHYRKSAYQYLYDGKFCHCIKAQIDMHQYRPCTDELCQLLCGHHEAECDKRTRRSCFCKTHQMIRNLGRRPDPGELNCDIACRYGLYDAKILDLKWETGSVDSWGVKTSKYCACLQTVSPAGLSHCDPYHDDCPKYCANPKAYCTREKYCHCGIMPPALVHKNPMIREGSGKEKDECGEKCASWLWPMVEDPDNKPYIYDEGLAFCSNGAESAQKCPKVDTSPWKPDKTGQMSVNIDSLELGDLENRRKFCLCAKTTQPLYKPGNRFIARIEPERIAADEIPCPFNHTCAIVGESLHIIG